MKTSAAYASHRKRKNQFTRFYIVLIRIYIAIFTYGTNHIPTMVSFYLFMIVIKMFYKCVVPALMPAMILHPEFTTFFASVMKFFEAPNSVFYFFLDIVASTMPTCFVFSETVLHQHPKPFTEWPSDRRQHIDSPIFMSFILPAIQIFRVNIAIVVRMIIFSASLLSSPVFTSVCMRKDAIVPPSKSLNLCFP